jgi:hypothetical protein
VSHYHHEVRDGREPLSFEEALDREEERLLSERDSLLTGSDWAKSHHRTHSYVSRGRWAEQLERWLSVLPRERLLVLFSERYFADPTGTLRDAAAFLGAPVPAARDLGRACDAVAETYRRQPLNPPTPSRILDRLRRAFAAPDDDLRRLLGVPLPWADTAR